MKMNLKRLGAFALTVALSMSIIPASTASAAFAGENTPDENVFSVGGKNFILLDSTGEGDERKYLILSKDFCGEKYYGKLDDSVASGSSYNKWEQVFYVDETDTNHIGYWLNTTYLNSELPVSDDVKMADYIPTMDWATEGGCSTLCKADYTVTAKVVVPSIAELDTYGDKIGYKDGITSAFWWTRSAWKPTWTATNDDKHAVRVVLTTGTYHRRCGAKGNVRPMFWLNNDFFDDFAIDIMNAGENVVEMIKANYTEDQLSDIYSADILLWLNGGEVTKPVISNVSVNGVLQTTETITANYDIDSLCDDTKTVIEWEVATETATGARTYGEWTNVGTGKDLVLTNSTVTAISTTETTPQYNGDTANRRKIRAKVTPYTADGVVGDVVYSEEYMTEPALGPLDRGFTMSNKITQAPAENVFEVDGAQFILLDTYEKNGERSYFVISKNAHGNRAIDSAANWTTFGDNNFTPTDKKTDKAMSEKHMAYWINSSEEGGFLHADTENTLPEGIKTYIDMNHVWRTESSMNAKSVQTGDYAFVAGVTIPSAREFQKYNDKIGYDDTGSNWWLRTGYAREPGRNMYVKYGTLVVERTIGNGARGVRPVFYLKNDFFKNVEVNVYNVGDAVKSLMKANYTEEELKAAGYDETEMNILYDRAVVEKPVVSLVAINGTGETLTTMTADVTYGDYADSSKTKYQWQLSTDGVSFTDILENTATGATTSSILVNNSIASYSKRFLSTYPEYGLTRYVRVKVVPVSAEGVEGEAVYSAAFKMPAAAGPISYRSSDVVGRMPEYASEDDIFVTGDKKFILLDTNENGEFLVLAADSYGKSTFDSDASQKYDTTDANNIGYIMNNSLFAQLPSKVKENALLKQWKTEAGNIYGNAVNDYYVEAQATLISLTELEKYAEKIGYNDIESTWVTRTPEGKWFKANDVSVKQVVTILGSGSLASYETNYGGFGIRPIVWLDRSFFIDADIVGTELGANVRSAMKDVYTFEELQSIYTNAELNLYFGLGDFVIEGADISSTAGNDSTINVSIKSYLPDSQEVLLIASVYDSTGKNLKGVASLPVEVLANDVTAKPITVNNNNPAEGDIIRIMLWSDWLQMVPLCSPVIAE